MINRLRNAVSVLPPNLIRAAIVIIVLPMIGTLGYIVIEGWSLSDAIYMTVMVVTTIGFREVQPLANLVVGEVLADEGKHLPFAGSENVGVLGPPSRSHLTTSIGERRANYTPRRRNTNRVIV